MRTGIPSSGDIDALVAFLPKLYGDYAEPVVTWSGMTKDGDGVFTLPYPQYNQTVRAFFMLASSDPWDDHDYVPEVADGILKDGVSIEKADLSLVKTLLTFCVRGERFCDGFWSEVIEAGYIKKLLLRLLKLRDESFRKASGSDTASRQ